MRKIYHVLWLPLSTLGAAFVAIDLTNGQLFSRASSDAIAGAITASLWVFLLSACGAVRVRDKENDNG